MTIARGAELFKHEIHQLTEGFPMDNTNDIDPQVCLKAFKQYDGLRLQRYNLELNQAVHFLEEYRIEQENNNRFCKELIILSPVRTLGRELSVQI
jgi:hypothetical protein